MSFNFTTRVNFCSDIGAKENKICHCFHFSPMYLSWNDGTRCHDLYFLNAEFQVSFLLSSFILIKRLFSSSSLSSIRVVSSPYMRWNTLKVKLCFIMSKASWGDGIPDELFQIIKDDTVKVLHLISQQMENAARATGLEKVSFHFNHKEGQCHRIFKLLHNCVHFTC